MMMEKSDVIIGLKTQLTVDDQVLDSHHVFVKHGDTIQLNLDVSATSSNKRVVLSINVDDIDINHTCKCSCGDTQPPEPKPKNTNCKPECISCENARFRPQLSKNASKIELVFKCILDKCAYSEVSVCDVCGDTITKIEMLSTLMLCNKPLCASCYRDACNGSVNEK